MKLQDLLSQANIEIISIHNEKDPEITGITNDSRKCKEGSLFVAIEGLKLNGEEYIKSAIENGAKAILSIKAPSTETDCVWIQVKNPRKAIGLLSRTLWGVDIEKISMVGITGTNGKTTTAHLFKKLFDTLYGLEKSWMFGTIEYHLGNTIKEASNTTPESSNIFQWIGEAKDSPQSIVMEVSSHSLSLERNAGFSFDAGIFTNLTQDHLDFHKTMEEYYQAKKLLFTNYLKANGTAILNVDDSYGERLARELIDIKVLKYGRAQSADIRIDSWKCDWSGTEINLVENGTPITCKSNLRGFFNVYNMTAFYAGARSLNISPEIIQKVFDSITTVNGRMDRVALDAPFTVVVDYAHTPDALENILKTSRELTKGNLICVFGCGGDRDKTKRPIMGEIVSLNCDEAVVTSDNPRSEKPDFIIRDILKGIPMDFPHLSIADRKEAIGYALRLAKPDDCIVIAGKGHETYQEIQGVKHPFDDKEIVKKLYLEMKHGA